MSAMAWVFAGAVIGAPLRYLTDRYVQSRHDGMFPWGTMSVNVVGSTVLGLVLATASPQVHLALGSGFCGALTTYSTFAFETMRLVERRARVLAVANVLVSVLAGVGGAVVGVAVGTALSS